MARDHWRHWRCRHLILEGDEIGVSRDGAVALREAEIVQLGCLVVEGREVQR